MLVLAVGCSPLDKNRLILEDWERGFVVTHPEKLDMQIFLWFYEWHLFDAVSPGIHTHGPESYGDWSIFPKSINESRTEGFVEIDGLRLDLKSAIDGVDMLLTIQNTSNHDWPEIAAIIPCLNPGPNPHNYPDNIFQRNKLFLDTDSTYTYFIGQEGITLLNNRNIHFNQLFRQNIEKLRQDSIIFKFDNKWKTSTANAYKGLIIRESIDGKWVTGIAWEDFISSQGHNPWLCMHLSIRVGPLKPGEKKEIRGKIYLLKGTKEDCYQKYLKDFKLQ